MVQAHETTKESVHRLTLTGYVIQHTKDSLHLSRGSMRKNAGRLVGI
jgi:hypothetical protein